jgi:hypothetical protein
MFYDFLYHRENIVFYDNKKPVKNYGYQFANCKLPPGKTELTITITDIVTVITSYGFRLITVNRKTAATLAQTIAKDTLD